MNLNDLLKGRKAKVMTDALVAVELEIDSIEEEKHSVELEPATRENDWWPATSDYTTFLVKFTNGFKKTYRSLSDLDVINNK